MLIAKLLWFSVWIFTVYALDGAVRSNVWSVNVNDATDNEVPSKATAKLGHDLKILCDMDYNLTFFAWYFCQFNCLSQTADWQIVVKVDHGNITNLNPSKFDMDTDGSLIFKDIQPSNDHNWVRCFFTKHYVYTDHRSTIIRVVQESPTITVKSAKVHVVVANMPLLLECDAKGYPVPWKAWVRNTQVLQNTTDKPNYLYLPNVTLEETGNYTCLAGNSVGNSSYTVYVTIKGDEPCRTNTPPGTHATESPTITVKSAKVHVVVANMPLLLECDAKGYPVPWKAWVRNTQVLQNTTDKPNYLYLPNVTLEETGNYTCLAGNSVGNSSYTVYVTIKGDEPFRTNTPPGTHATDPIKEIAKGIGIGLVTGVVLGVVVALLFVYVLGRRGTRRNVSVAVNDKIV